MRVAREQNTMKSQQDRETMRAEAHVAGNVLQGQILVVKLGGSTLAHQRLILHDLIWLQAQGVHPVLVHGGGPAITAWLQTMHIPTRFEHGLRVTDAQTLEVVSMVLRGQINEQLVLMTAEMGGKAAGISGTDGQMVQGHIADERLGWVGEIDAIDPTNVFGLIDEGYLTISSGKWSLPHYSITRRHRHRQWQWP